MYKRKNYHNKEPILVDCANEDLLHIDENVSDTESIYSITRYQDLADIETNDTDSEDNALIAY